MLLRFFSSCLLFSPPASSAESSYKGLSVSEHNAAIRNPYRYAIAFGGRGGDWLVDKICTFTGEGGKREEMIEDGDLECFVEGIIENKKRRLINANEMRGETYDISRYDDSNSKVGQLLKPSLKDCVPSTIKGRKIEAFSELKGLLEMCRYVERNGDFTRLEVSARSKKIAIEYFKSEMIVERERKVTQPHWDKEVDTR